LGHGDGFFTGGDAVQRLSLGRDQRQLLRDLLGLRFNGLLLLNGIGPCASCRRWVGEGGEGEGGVEAVCC
jgi:hypothetical protein